ncbi:hypothetical protein P8452_18598 [Trifolium repens]|nr:hypothetical protein P8452_18598 [Trifolium repens]
MNPKILIVFFLLLNLISISIQNPNPKIPKSIPSPAHVELASYGFPVGLLPATTVLSHNINHTSGDFSVKLGGACKITLPPDNYVATYSDTITGKIVKGKIAELNGIRLEWLLLSIPRRILMIVRFVRVRSTLLFDEKGISYLCV